MGQKHLAAVLIVIAAAIAVISPLAASPPVETQAPTAPDTAPRQTAISSPKPRAGIPSRSPDVPSGVNLGAARPDGNLLTQPLSGGRRAVFTLDPDLQRFAVELFAKYEVPAGAAVVLETRTGRVLTMAQQRRSPEAAELSEVALDASPPAASLFKVVTAAALLERGGVNVTTETCYSGGSERLVLANLEEPAKGRGACATLTRALGSSLNAVLARLADQHLDRDTLAEYAHKFRFGEPLPFDLPVSPSAVEIPDDRLERARASAGFWHTHLSPLHAAMIAQSLAQQGNMLRPYVVDRVEGPSGDVLYRGARQVIGTTVGKQTAQQLVTAMVDTVKSGTARKAFHDRRGRPFLPGIEVSGKTGTLTGDTPYRAYTWFMAVAPADKPEVAIAVLVVNEPKWRIKAASAASQILKKHFDLKTERARTAKRNKLIASPSKTTSRIGLSRAS